MSRIYRYLTRPKHSGPLEPLHSPTSPAEIELEDHAYDPLKVVPVQRGLSTLRPRPLGRADGAAGILTPTSPKGRYPTSPVPSASKKTVLSMETTAVVSVTSEHTANLNSLSLCPLGSLSTSTPLAKDAPAATGILTLLDSLHAAINVSSFDGTPSSVPFRFRGFADFVVVCSERQEGATKFQLLWTASSM